MTAHRGTVPARSGRPLPAAEQTGLPALSEVDPDSERVDDEVVLQPGTTVVLQREGDRPGRRGSLTRSAEAVVRVELLPSEGLSAHDRLELRALWDAAFAGSFAAEDEDHAYGGVHAVVRAGTSVLAHGSVVPRDLLVGEETLRAGYVEAVASLPTYQGRGLGTQVMAALGDVVREQLDLGALSTSAHGFYERLGWERWRGPSYVLRAGARVRSEDEDEGLMVLRTPRTAELDLHLPIVCHDRPGDAW